MASRAASPLISAALLAAIVTAGSVPARAQDAPGDAPTAAPAAEPLATVRIVPSQWLLLESPDLRVRRPFGPSAQFARYLLDRDAAPPHEGDELTGERGTPVRWTAAEVKDGVLDPRNATYAFTSVTSDIDQILMADVQGAFAVWVNGEPFVGDGYGYGFGGVPVQLRKGENRIYLAGLRGGVRAAFTTPGADVFPAGWDATVPDLLGGEDDVRIGVLVANATDTWQTRTVVAGFAGGAPVASTDVLLPPLGVTKVPLRLGPAPERPAVPATAALVNVSIENGDSRSGNPVRLAWKGGGDARRVTRVSAIDGSVQEHSVLEPAPSLVAVPTRIVLSLHGASVDALGQAKSYSRRPGFWIVCPTNRRPYGFDWQDWGRLDAYEALDWALSTLGETRRIYLTGHSMGGHGTWHLAANDPDRVLAIAPSAGWRSFDTYGGRRPASVLDALWRGADGATDTLALVPNLAPLPTFVLHGTADDNVPVSEAETMLAALRAAGGAPLSHFQEGAGHWWNGDAAPGADCVDWPRIFDLFEQTEPGPAPVTLDWTTMDPSVDRRDHWVSLAQPLEYGRPTRIRATWDAATRTAQVTTENAGWMSVGHPGEDGPWHVVVDGATFDVQTQSAQLLRRDGKWNHWPTVGLGGPAKSPATSGPLKHAFGRRFVLVVPTRGTAEESRETAARVRYDAESWWYRGNGFADIAEDKDVLADPQRFAGRNLILYGNADTNAAWAKTVGDASPMDVRRGSVRVGTRLWKGDGRACFAVLPRRDDRETVVAVLGDTGARGCRLALSHALFTSGVGYPDYVAWDERTLSLGDGGVLAAGWFDAGWRLDGRGFTAFGGEPATDAQTDPSAPAPK